MLVKLSSWSEYTKKSILISNLGAFTSTRPDSDARGEEPEGVEAHPQSWCQNFQSGVYRNLDSNAGVIRSKSGVTNRNG